MTSANPRDDKGGALTRLFRAVKRAVLNKSGEEYTAGLSGGEQYWDEAVKANLRSAEAGQKARNPGPPGAAP